MNQSTRGWGQSRGKEGGRRDHSIHRIRRMRRLRRIRANRDLRSRLPGVLLASLGLAVLGATVMWSAVSTAEGASDLSTEPVTVPVPVPIPVREPVREPVRKPALKPAPTPIANRAPSFTLVSTVTSDAPAQRDLTESGHRVKRAGSIETVPLRILLQEPIERSGLAQRSKRKSETRRVAPGRKTSRPTAQTTPRQKGAAAKDSPATRPATRPTARPTAKRTTRPRGRLPRYFGKVGVSATQKRRVYAIQAMYRDRAEILTRQLEELRSQERLEVLEVLTALQKQRLAELIRMAEVAREARLRARQKSQPSQPGRAVQPRPSTEGTLRRPQSGSGGTTRR